MSLERMRLMSKIVQTFVLPLTFLNTVALNAAPVQYVRFFTAEINGAGNFTSTGLANGALQISSSDGTYLLNHPYLASPSNLSSTPPFVISLAGFPFNPELVSPVISYQPDGTFITLQTQFEDFAGTRNQKTVAYEIDKFADPAPSLESVLQSLANLSIADLNNALAQMSGEQYTTQMFLADVVNMRFTRRLYDPLRAIITRMAPSENCSECCEGNETLTWIEGGYSGTNLNTDHGYGLNAKGYEIVVGSQCQLEDDLTVGAALGYYQDIIHYKTDGNSRMSTVLLGLYGLYRPECHYLLGDFTFGVSRNKMHRKTILADTTFQATGRYNILQGTFYGEAGFDYFYDSFLIQPFAGIEFGYAHRNAFTENGADPINLFVHTHDLFKSYSRLGGHFSTTLCKVKLNLDLAWLYRLGNLGNVAKEHFESFGTDFNVYGASQQRCGYEGTLSLQAPVNDCVSLYADLYGSIWSKASTWSALAGIEVNW